jgi:hypothetical protein
VFVDWCASRRVRARVVAVGSTLTAATVLASTSLAAGFIPAQLTSAPTANIGTSVTGMTAVPVKNVTVSAATKSSYTPSAAKSTWPQASTGTLTITAPGAKRAGQAGAKSQAAGTPVWAQAVASSTGTYTGPSSVKVSVQPKSLATELGLAGTVWSLGSANAGSGSVRVGLDYSSFA